MASRELPPGLYDDLATVALDRLIDGLDASSRAQLSDLPDGDAPTRLSRHVADAVAMVLDAFDDEGRERSTTAGCAPRSRGLVCCSWRSAAGLSG